MKFGHFLLSIALTTSPYFVAAMQEEHDAPAAENAITLNQAVAHNYAQRERGIAGVLDRAGTAAQYLALPLILAAHADHTLPEVSTETIFKAALLNCALVYTGNWVLGGPIRSYAAPHASTPENWPQYLGRKIINGAIHATNLAAKNAVLLGAATTTIAILLEKK